MKVFWLEVYPIDPATGNEVPYLFTTYNNPMATAIQAGKTYLPYLESYPKTEVTVFNGEFDGFSETKIERLTISQGDLSLIQWPNYVWDGARAKVFKGYDTYTSWAQVAQVFDGVILTSPEFSESSVTISVDDHASKLAIDNMATTYLGTGGIEGSAGLKGVYKPLPIGYPTAIEPVLIEAPFSCFQYCGYGECEGVLSLWENGLDFGAKTATVAYAGSVAATYTALKNTVLTVGQWADAPSIGCFRLGGEPKSGGVITADVGGLRNVAGSYTYDTLAQVITYFLSVAGEDSRINTTSLNALQTATDARIADYFLQPDKIDNIVQSYLRGVGGYMMFTTTGGLKFGLVRMVGSPTYTLDEGALKDASNLPVAVTEDWNLLPVSAPFKELKLGYNKTHRVHNANEISDALYEAVEALGSDVITAQQTADNAAADIATVEAAMANIGADNVLSRVEKQVVIADKKQLDDEHAAIDTRATAYAITTLKTDYDTAYTALGTYLTGLTPAWDSTTVDTPIDRTTFKSKWADVYYKRQLLLNEIAARAHPVNRGAWATATAYVLGDYFQWNGSSYEVITAHTSTGSSPDFTKTLLIAAAGSKVVTIYTRSYSTPTAPTGGGTPTGWSTNIPAGTASLWTTNAVQTADDVLVGSWATLIMLDVGAAQAYGSGIAFLARQLTTYNGGTYVALVDTTNHAPSGDANANAYWGVVAAPGAQGAPGTPPSPFSATINLTSGAAINLRSLANAAGYTGASDATITYNVPNTVVARGLSGALGGGTGGYGIDSGTWPSGYTLTLSLVVQSGGIVDGGGGAGGDGPLGDGGAGGDAIYCRVPMSVTINSGGMVRAGGGGGDAGAERYLSGPGTFVGGNGGSGGFPNGAAGRGEAMFSPDTPGADGNAGTTAGGGAAVGTSNASKGGAGGNAGVAGYGSGTAQTAGAGGAAGYAVRKNGYTVTVTNNGTMTGTAA